MARKFTIEESNSREKNRQLSNTFSNSVSFFALIISCLSIYFSIFYKDHKLTVSIIDSEISVGASNVITKILYHNQGNISSTILQDYLIFFQDSDWQNNGVIFNNSKHVYNVDYDPIILVPGQQHLRSVNAETRFKEIDSLQRKLNIKKQIQLGLVVTYINDNGLRTNDMFPIGLLTLNNDGFIIKYNINYNIFELNAQSFFSKSEIR